MSFCSNYAHLWQVLGDLLYVLSLASNDEPVQPARSLHMLYGNTVRLFIHLYGEGNVLYGTMWQLTSVQELELISGV